MMHSFVSQHHPFEDDHHWNIQIRYVSLQVIGREKKEASLETEDIQHILNVVIWICFYC